MRKGKNFKIAIVFFIIAATAAVFLVFQAGDKLTAKEFTNVPPPKPKLDTIAYDLKLYQLAHIATSTLVISTSTGQVWVATTSGKFSSTTLEGMKNNSLWPVRTVYPDFGALLPFNRIVAFYGNFLSKQMGILGEYPRDEVLEKLKSEVASWQAAEPDTPVIPAVEYIAVTAQGSAVDGKYRSRMVPTEIEKAIDMAALAGGLVILDVQNGQSTLSDELPPLEPFLKLPQVHLAIDPEFSMKIGKLPGTVVGTMDASDINYAADFLARIVRENNLTPKLLIVHRYTMDMVTNYKMIQPLPEVQIVMDMDGWGTPEGKIQTYIDAIYKEPVQFTGFKIFYKNDLWKEESRLMTPAEILKLTPEPSFIMYQ